MLGLGLGLWRRLGQAANGYIEIFWNTCREVWNVTSDNWDT
jgi:hypothetical protein